MEPSRTRARLASFALTSLLVLGTTACGSSGSDTTALSGADTSTTSEVETTTMDPGSSTTATSTAASDSTTTTFASGLTKQGFQLRPVLATDRCGVIAERETAPGEDVLTEDDLGMDDDAICYLVGPAAADGTDIATAEAVLDGSGPWVISVTAAESSRDRLNTMFNACNAGDSTCPGPFEPGPSPGAVAIVVDGIVCSAPRVQAENLADDAFTISGDFTKTEAGQLAQTLNG